MGKIEKNNRDCAHRKLRIANDQLLSVPGLLRMCPVWTYGIQLWGTASNPNVEILQRFQSKTLRSLLDASWYVTNETIHRDLEIPTVKEEISKYSNRYMAALDSNYYWTTAAQWLAKQYRI